MKKREAFTLIELIAVLVILAILALIVTPLVLNIIKKARTSADKRSIDAYGRSIELAIADYLLDNGTFPTSIDQLTIEYTGDKVVCTHATLNGDSSVYLAECTVGGRSVSDYTYGKEQTITYDAYEIGDEVTYNEVNYYVIKDSDTTESTVTLLKAEPLTVAEISKYGVGHINRYADGPKDIPFDIKGDGTVGGMVYYTSEDCTSYSAVQSLCINSYLDSEIKYAVDAWAEIQVSKGLVEAKLIEYDDLKKLGYIDGFVTPSDMGLIPTENTPTWIQDNIYGYWTMSPVEDSLSAVWYVANDGVKSANVHAHYSTSATGVRPVIVLSKSVL